MTEDQKYIPENNQTKNNAKPPTHMSIASSSHRLWQQLLFGPFSMNCELFLPPQTPELSFIKSAQGFWGKGWGSLVLPGTWQHLGFLIITANWGLCPAEHQHHCPLSSREEGRQQIQQVTNLPSQTQSWCVQINCDLHKSRSCHLKHDTEVQNPDWDLGRPEMPWGEALAAAKSDWPAGTTAPKLGLRAERSR